MAREVHEREDLLRDAKALVPRVQIEFLAEQKKCALFAGFRSSSALCLYFDDDPVYQFNNSKQLRRAYVDDRIIKAEKGRLVSMTRLQSPTSSELLRHEMSDDEQQQLLSMLYTRLANLKELLLSNQYQLIGQAPEDGDAIAQLQNWLDNQSEISIADSPRVCS